MARSVRLSPKSCGYLASTVSRLSAVGWRISVWVLVSQALFRPGPWATSIVSSAGPAMHCLRMDRCSFGSARLTRRRSHPGADGDGGNQSRFRVRIGVFCWSAGRFHLRLPTLFHVEHPAPPPNKLFHVKHLASDSRFLLDSHRNLGECSWGELSPSPIRRAVLARLLLRSILQHLSR